MIRAWTRVTLSALHAAESTRYVARHPRSAALARASEAHFLYGLPMHWMRDWPLPHPLFLAEASGQRLRCVDGHEMVDFCLGDTGAMFGHSPAPVARALAEQGARGLTAMLPGEALADVGAALARVFGLPRWQLTLSATDANRFALRWARAITGRPKVLVFDGCYHGTLDDTLVDLAPDGRTVTRRSLLGQVQDLSLGAVVVPFNDLPAVEAALAAGDVAAVLTEPALTNCGLVLPAAGFLEAVQDLCRAQGTVFMLDETHTVSTGLGGYARVHGLAPDLLVVGKAVAGGLPCAVYGFSEELTRRMQQAKAAMPEGHSGIGTTLSGSLLAVAALRATLAEVMTAEAYARMSTQARALELGLRQLLADAALPWTVTRLGARLELQYCATPPRSAQEARAALDAPLQAAMQLFLVNQGVLITPFHNMWLLPPMAGEAEVQAALSGIRSFVGELLA